MKTLIVLILSCASVFGEDTGIHVVTTAKTNQETGSISTKEVFTRNGQTNLVCNTKTKAGVVEIRIHRFYQAGLLVGDFVALPDSSGFTTEAGSPYSVSFEFGSSKEVKSAVIGTKDGVILDAFNCTNGVFHPAELRLIHKANAVGTDMKQLFDPEHVRTTSPEKFVGEAEDLIEKHKD
ncbi:MAG: hypothetical protein ACLQU4_00325 [Limisphaerales bacterium]